MLMERQYESQTAFIRGGVLLKAVGALAWK